MDSTTTKRATRFSRETGINGWHGEGGIFLRAQGTRLSVDRKFGGERFDMAAYYKFPWTDVDVVVPATNRLCDTRVNTRSSLPFRSRWIDSSGCEWKEGRIEWEEEISLILQRRGRFLLDGLFWLDGCQIGRRFSRIFFSFWLILVGFGDEINAGEKKEFMGDWLRCV